MTLEMNEANAMGLIPSDSETCDALRSMKPREVMGCMLVSTRGSGL